MANESDRVGRNGYGGDLMYMQLQQRGWGNPNVGINPGGGIPGGGTPGVGMPGGGIPGGGNTGNQQPPNYRDMSSYGQETQQSFNCWCGEGYGYPGLDPSRGPQQPGDPDPIGGRMPPGAETTETQGSSSENTEQVSTNTSNTSKKNMNYEDTLSVFKNQDFLDKIAGEDGEVTMDSIEAALNDPSLNLSEDEKAACQYFVNRPQDFESIAKIGKGDGDAVTSISKSQIETAYGWEVGRKNKILDNALENGKKLGDNGEYLVEVDKDKVKDLLSAGSENENTYYIDDDNKIYIYVKNSEYPTDEERQNILKYGKRYEDVVVPGVPVSP